jgi:hypothetical protein
MDSADTNAAPANDIPYSFLCFVFWFSSSTRTIGDIQAERDYPIL